MGFLYFVAATLLVLSIFYPVYLHHNRIVDEIFKNMEKQAIQLKIKKNLDKIEKLPYSGQPLNAVIFQTRKLNKEIEELTKQL